MKILERASFWLIAPYAAWMALMMCLPSAPWAYSVRTAATLVLLAAAAVRRGKDSAAPAVEEADSAVRRGKDSAAPAVEGSDSTGDADSCPLRILCGVVIGLLVLVIWIAPDRLPWYREFCVIGDPYAHAKALPLDSAFTWIQLFGSAFVISAAEELFFRKWLIRYAGFGWMVVLFAIEHNRPAVATICGVLYGLLYLRKGLLAAIVAHATTNLALGLFVIRYNRWEFW